jgi:DNA-binding IscR family transcriptional regulator
MLDLYRSVSEIEKEKLFRIHNNPNPDCPVGANIQETVSNTFIAAQNAMERLLEVTTLADIVSNLSKKIEKK